MIKLLQEEQKEKKIQTLPKGEENDALDGEKLNDGIKGLEEILGGEIEEEETVEGEGDGDVVDDGDVEVATVYTPVTISVGWVW